MGDLVERLEYSLSQVEIGTNVGMSYSFAHDMLSALTDQADEIARLREALERQCDNMAFTLNKATLPDQWYCKFADELARDREALQHKEPQG